MSRPQHSPQRDAAWGRFYGRMGARPVLPAPRWPPVLTPEQRLENWRRQYVALPIEQQVEPIRRVSA